MRKLTLTALPGMPEIKRGAALGELLVAAVARAGEKILAGDIVVIAQKIVSKAEGRMVRLGDITPSLEARDLAQKAEKDPRLVELVLRESRAVLRVKPGVIIVEHRLGFVMASAGIDQSNVAMPGEEVALLLPEDPDASARRIRDDLRQAHGADVGVVINDSFGRAWRNGVAGVAIGVAGIPALVDLRGNTDRGGRALRVTQVAAADELAAAASLVMGQADEGLPAVLARGFPYPLRAGAAQELVRPRAEDLFPVIVALAGGVGGARLAVGLAAVLPPGQLAVVVNTGDDFEHLGLTICPDLDTVMYTLAGINNPRAGWGRKDESWNFMETLGALGGDTWFNLGDRDLAVHVLRSHALHQGVALSDVTRALAAHLGVRHSILPMSETPVRTRVRTDRGELSFQDYFVRLRYKPRVRAFRVVGSRHATPPASLQKLLSRGAVEAAIVCPSNPYVSIAPILAVPAIGAWIRRRDFPVVAVSPIIGRAAVKGPAAKMMRELGQEASALGVARYYGGLVDGWIIDSRDAKLRPAIEREGKHVLVTDTLMKNRTKSARLAAATLAFARNLARGASRG